MAKKKIVKCRYAHCLHESKDVNTEEAVHVGNMYYHQDCFQVKEDINKIVELFAMKVNPNVVYPVLKRTVNNIVFGKGVASDFLLFGLNYYIKKKIPLNYPAGLYYVIQNKDVQKEYDKQFTKRKTVQIYMDDAGEEKTFQFKPKKQIGFDSILKGDAD